MPGRDNAKPEKEGRTLKETLTGIVL
jgi:hypothetical protein